MTRRTEFIALAILPQANVGELCRRFAISRKTGCKWLARYRAVCRPCRINPAGPGAARGLRRVKSHGEITFQNRSFYIGAAFRTQPSALLPTLQDGRHHERFHAYAIGQIDLRVPNSKPKGNYRPMDKITARL